MGQDSEASALNERMGGSMFSFSRIAVLANGMLLGFGMLVAAGAASAEDRVSLPSRAGVTEPILYQAAASPFASVVLFPGGNGALAGLGGNFLMRVRDQFPAQGISVAVMDVPSDRDTAPTGYRTSPAAAADLKPVVEFLKQKAAVPVWLVGTSAGSISAGNGATRLGAAQVSGLVLTSSVWNGGMQQVPLADRSADACHPQPR